MAHGDLLRAQDLADGLRPPGARLHCGVIGDHHRGAAFDFPDAGDYACRRGLAFVAIIGDQQADFLEAGAGIEQAGDALACGELAGAMLFFESGWSAAGAQAFFEAMQLIDQVAHVRGCGDGVRCLRDHAFSLSSSVFAPARKWLAEKCRKVMKSDEFC